MTERDATSSELTDAQIVDIFLQYPCRENDWGDAIDFCRAVIAAHLALNQPSPAQSERRGDAAMPVVAWLHDWRIQGPQEVVKDWISQDYDEAHDERVGCHNIRPLVKQSDALAALAAKDAEIDRLTAELEAPESLAVRVMRAQILELTAERDGLKRDAELLPVAIAHLAEWVDAVQRNGSGWDDWDEHFKDAAYRPGPLRELIDANLAAIAKESGK